MGIAGIRKIPFALLIAAALARLPAETFRVRKTTAILLPGYDDGGQTATTGINDSIAIFLPDDMTYVEGVEIKMQIPPIVSEWQDSVAFSLYDNITPVPAEGNIDYSGTRIFVTPLPSKLSWILQIPLKERNSLKGSSYTTKADVIPDTARNFIFLRFQPAMKGIPDETMDAEISMNIKPLLVNKGRLALSISTPDKRSAPVDIFIDEKPAPAAGSAFMLEAGMHSLTVQSAEYRSEVRSVYIEQAKTTELRIELKSLAPTLLVTAPDNAEIFLDDAPFLQRGTPVRISEGEHKLRFIMGGYEILRALDIRKGKSYNANFSVNLQVTEE